MKHRFIGLAALVAAIAAYPAVAQSPWLVTVLDEPFHVGDNVAKTMKRPAPQGRELRREFVLPDTTPPAYLYVTLWISEMIPKNHPALKKGQYRDLLQINDQEVELLNKKIDPPESPEMQKVIIQVKGSILRSGTNTLTIIAGAAGGNLDDFEVHKIMISKERQ